MTVKHFIATLLIIMPFFLIAQRDSSSKEESSLKVSKATLRRQRSLEKREHIKKLIDQEEEGALVYHKQWGLGLKLNTDGESLFFEHGKYKTKKRTNLWWLELSEKKSQNQQKQTPAPTITTYPGFSVISIGNNFYFGKENNFYQLKFGLGRQILIGNKGTNNGVAVSAIFGGGFSLGILKPYYLQVLDSTSSTALSDIKYSDYPTAFLDPYIIVGASDFGKGFSSLHFVPGVHARSSLRFDYGRYRETLSALEVGFNVDFYTEKVSIMVQNPTKNLFLNVYVGIVFGGRH